MASKREAIVVFVTCASGAEARRIAQAAVTKRLAACGSIANGGVTSIYRWKGKVEKANEVLLILKTTQNVFPELEREIRKVHSYETPEVIALPVVQGSKAYLSWIRESVSQPNKLRR